MAADQRLLSDIGWQDATRPCGSGDRRRLDADRQARIEERDRLRALVDECRALLVQRQVCRSLGVDSEWAARADALLARLRALADGEEGA